METQVCGDGRGGAASLVSARGRESLTQATDGRSDAGQAHAAGGSPNIVVKPAQRRSLVHFLRVGCRVSERRACRVNGMHCTRYGYRSRAQDQTALRLRLRLRELPSVRVRYGYRRLNVLLRREGWPITHKWVYRLEGLVIRKKRPVPCGRACLRHRLPTNSGAWIS